MILSKNDKDHLLSKPLVYADIVSTRMKFLPIEQQLSFAVYLELAIGKVFLSFWWVHFKYVVTISYMRFIVHYNFDRLFYGQFPSKKINLINNLIE